MVDSLFVSVLDHSCDCLETIIDASVVLGRDLTELKTDLLGEGHTVLSSNDSAVFEIYLVGDNNTSDILTFVGLHDLLVPVSEELECVLVGNIVDKNEHIGVAHQLVGDFLENILTCHIDAMELNP